MNQKNSIDLKYKKLDDIDHVLHRSGMYIGSKKPHTASKWVFIDGKMIQKEVTYNPGFLKIFDEIITNSVDESKREGSKLNTIKVTIKDDLITIWDNGGIPVVKHTEYKEWIPELVFSNLKAGANFDDDIERTGAGTNGVGSTLTNIYSSKFSISTCDGINLFTQTYRNNMRDRDKAKVKKSTKNHTEISFLPDYSKFNLTGIDDDHSLMLHKRVIDIAASNPGLKIYFNGQLINIKTFQDYIKFYIDESFYEQSKDKRWSIGIALSENGFQQVSFANSTETYDGGTHVDYILNQIIVELRAFFMKKHKVDVKPSELKNHMFLFINSTVVNPGFSSQTKEKLITEVKEFGSTFEVSSKFISQILKSEIVNSILDWIQQKQDADENKALRELNKNLGKVKVDKLIDAKGKDRWKCSIGIFEGDSAISAFRDYRDPQTMGAYALRGKFTNVSELPTKKLVEDEQVFKLMSSIGLKLGHKPELKDLRYGRILFYCDADVDGNSIVALLINFFHKFWPELFEKKMIYKIETPIVVASHRKNKTKKSFYSLTEYNEFIEKTDTKDWELNYKKGLATLTDDEYEDIICKPKMLLLKKDDTSIESLDIWFGKNSDLRKNEMLK